MYLGSSSLFDSRYKFSGKTCPAKQSEDGELDEATGYNYFGARYFPILTT
jgi:hypothetical protein